MKNPYLLFLLNMQYEMSMVVFFENVKKDVYEYDKSTQLL